MLKTLKKIFTDPGEVPVMAMLFYMACAIFFWTLQCSLLQNVLGLDIIETVIWGAQGAWGHAKHPPLSGWVGYGFSCLSNHADWGLYLAAQVFLVTGVFYAYKLARLFMETKAAVLSGLLLYFLFYFTPSEMKFSTYYLEIALRPMIAYYFFLALKEHKIKDWTLFGFCCGLGLLNKYSIGLLFLPLVIVFLLYKDYRKQFFTWGPWIAGIVFLLVIAPHVKWLYDNDWVCFTHVSHRMEEEPYSFIPILVIGATVYPFAMEGFMMFLSLLPNIRHWNKLPDFKEWERKTPDWSLAKKLLWLTMVPCVFFIIIAFCGSDIILMWFCSLASWTGIIVVALFPFVISKKIFNRVYAFLWIFTICVYAGTTYGLLTSSSPRLHAYPREITEPALKFWAKYRGNDPIPVVAGDRWYAGVIENYTAQRPPACEIADRVDPVFLARYKDTIQKKGALLISKKPEDFKEFFETMNIDSRDVKYEKIRYMFCAKYDPEPGYRNCVVGYLPPLKERGQSSK